MTADELVGLLAQPQRLLVVAALVLGASTLAEIETATGLAERDVVKALRKLDAGGLVELSAGGILLHANKFSEVARAAVRPRHESDYGYADPKVSAVVAAFIVDGRLLGLLAQHARRRIVLEHIVQSFEPGRRYAEREVNVVFLGPTVLVNAVNRLGHASNRLHGSRLNPSCSGRSAPAATSTT